MEPIESSGGIHSHRSRDATRKQSGEKPRYFSPPPGLKRHTEKLENGFPEAEKEPHFG